MNQPHRPKPNSAFLIELLGAIVIIGIIIYNFLGTQQSATPNTPPTVQPVTATVSPDEPPLPADNPSAASPTSPLASDRQATSFDFYVLALSWSPDYCADNGQNDPQQCSLGKKLGFVLHGLWPQYNKGYPANCSKQKLPAAVKSQFNGLYPADKLYDHEWEKHGTCSNLKPAQYLALTKQFKDSVAIPAAYRAPQQPVRVTTNQFTADFAAANPGLSAANLAVNCSGSGRYLKELYVCFSLQGQPTACSSEVLKQAAKSCAKADFLVRNVR
jgi:ribonuclease T2